MKRCVDFLFSFVGLIVLSPLFVFVFIMIKIKMTGPVFFIQKRVGKNGKLFNMIKFRTMIIEHSGSSISVAGDNRITTFGKTLRKHKIDELPTVFNVLLGDMSIVGPRPDVLGYADKLVGENRNILKLRPGITSPASIKYANEEEVLAGVENPQEYNDTIIYPDKIKINLDYYYNRTFIGDIKIILNTVFKTHY